MVLTQGAAPVDQDPQHRQLLVVDHRTQTGHPGADQGDGVGVGGVGPTTLASGEHPGVASGFLMTGVAILSAVTSTAGTLTTAAGAADAHSAGFIGAAVLGSGVAVYALLRMPATPAAGGGGHMHMH